MCVKFKSNGFFLLVCSVAIMGLDGGITSKLLTRESYSTDRAKLRSLLNIFQKQKLDRTSL